MANDGESGTLGRDGGRPPSLRKRDGFSLIETMLALALLALVMVTLAAGLSQSVRMSSFTRTSSAALLLAQEQITSLRAQFASGDTALTGITGTVGCPLNSQNEIDFQQSPVSGYQNSVAMQYGNDSTSQTENFDVRWNIEQLSISGSSSPSGADAVHLITVSVRPPDAFNTNVVTLHAMVQ